jgi:hypothetical protein
MTNELRNKIDNYEVDIQRRGVYEFIENNGRNSGKLCLVISAGDRTNDRLQSILILSDIDRPGQDRIGVYMDEVGTYYAACGLVTYCKRTNIGRQVARLSRDSMRLINRQISMELGLEERNRCGVLENTPDYEKLYKDLLESLERKEKV